MERHKYVGFGPQNGSASSPAAFNIPAAAPDPAASGITGMMTR
jgi:hypothetical protein